MVDVPARAALHSRGTRRVHERGPAPATRQVGHLARCSCGVETAATGAAYVGSATVVGDEAPAPVADELRHRRRCLGVAPRHAKQGEEAEVLLAQAQT